MSIIARILILHIRLLVRRLLHSTESFAHGFRHRLPRLIWMQHASWWHVPHTGDGSPARVHGRVVVVVKALILMLGLRDRGYGIGVSACARNDQASRVRFASCTLTARAAHQLTPIPPCFFHLLLLYDVIWCYGMLGHLHHQRMLVCETNALYFYEMTTWFAIFEPDLSLAWYFSLLACTHHGFASVQQRCFPSFHWSQESS